MLILKSVNFEQQQFQNHHLKKSSPDQTEWFIGRNTNCDLVLSNPEVSRMHGRITYSENAYYFVDIGSSSGSLLNGETLAPNQPRELHSGDLLQLGDTFLYVDGLESPVPAASIVDPEIVASSFSQLDNQWNQEDLLCRCCRIVDETPDVKTFYFTAEPPILFTYKPGQFVNLAIEIDGKPVIRAYSISSSPTRPYHLSLTIKRVPSASPDAPPGLVSNWLHDHLQVGDRVKFIGGAMGHFTCLPKLPAKMLFISAGSGITPMMSMSRWVQDTLIDSDILFLYSARTSEDIIFRSELEALSAQMPNFRLVVTLTKQPLGKPWMGLTGHISRSMLQLVAPDLLERTVFVCGPNGFMQTVRSLLEELQFPMENYNEESFGGPKLPKVKQPVEPAIAEPEPPPTAIRNGKGQNLGALLENLPPATKLDSTKATPAIQFTKSARTVPADDGASILEIAEQEGIPIRAGCRVGSCGVCKVRVSQGEVRYDAPPTALTNGEQQTGYALACVAYPVSQVAVEA